MTSGRRISSSSTGARRAKYRRRRSRIQAWRSGEASDRLGEEKARILRLNILQRAKFQVPAHLSAALQVSVGVIKVGAAGELERGVFGIAEDAAHGAANILGIGRDHFPAVFRDVDGRWRQILDDRLERCVDFFEL